MKEITPEGSVVPVFLVPLTKEQKTEMEAAKNVPSIEEIIATQIAHKESALKKLAKLGLTEDEAKAVIGL